MRFSDSDKAMIMQAVIAAEKQTSGEIVPVIAHQSGDYAEVFRKISAIGIGLAAVIAICVHARYPFFDVRYLILFPILGHSLGYVLMPFGALTRWVVGGTELAENVHNGALAAFSRHGLHHTKGETGVLIYISLLEHRVEILADRGIHSKVGEGYWREEVAKIVAGIKEKRAASALAEVIQEIGAKLAQHFPAAPGDKNELPDDLRSR